MSEKQTKEYYDHQFAQGFCVTDSKNRKIRIKKPNFMAALRLTDALGKSAENEKYFNMVQPMLWVTAIDDQPFSIGFTKREVEAAYERLGEAGFDAFNNVMIDYLSTFDAEKQEINIGAEDIEQIKK